jgi:hypothetical protein
MLVRYPEAFWFDLQFTANRVEFSPLTQIGLILVNYSLLLANQVWVALGLTGLFLIQDARFRNFTLAFFGLTFVFAARSVALVGLGAYQFLPFVPVMALGLGAFLLVAHDRLAEWVNTLADRIGLTMKLTSTSLRVLAVGATFLVLGTPWLFAIFGQIRALDSSLATEISHVLVDPEDAYETAAYVNNLVGQDDLVVASPALAWLINARVTDFQISLAYGGYETRHFPSDIPHSRFVFDPSVARARYVVVDRIWDNWAEANVPDLDVILDAIEAWPLAAEFGEFRVYENPDF